MAAGLGPYPFGGGGLAEGRGGKRLLGDREQAWWLGPSHRPACSLPFLTGMTTNPSDLLVLTRWGQRVKPPVVQPDAGVIQQKEMS